MPESNGGFPRISETELSSMVVKKDVEVDSMDEIGGGHLICAGICN